MNWDTVTWSEFMDVLVHYRDYYYRRTSYEQYYLETFSKINSVPIRLKTQHIQSLHCFLNKWKCRFSNQSAPIALSNWLNKNAQRLEKLADLSIEDPMILSRQEEIDQIYASLLELKRSGIHNMSDACASKILHLMIPSLFVMWDVNIKRNMEQYSEFMVKMHHFALRLKNELIPQAGRDDPDHFLQKLLGYPLCKPLTKYIDEYNWYSAVGHRSVKS